MKKMQMPLFGNQIDVQIVERTVRLHRSTLSPRRNLACPFNCRKPSPCKCKCNCGLCLSSRCQLFRRQLFQRTESSKDEFNSSPMSPDLSVAESVKNSVKSLPKVPILGASDLVFVGNSSNASAVVQHQEKHHIIVIGWLKRAWKYVLVKAYVTTARPPKSFKPILIESEERRKTIPADAPGALIGICAFRIASVGKPVYIKERDTQSFCTIGLVLEPPSQNIQFWSFKDVTDNGNPHIVRLSDVTVDRTKFQPLAQKGGGQSNETGVSSVPQTKSSTTRDGINPPIDDYSSEDNTFGYWIPITLPELGTKVDGYNLRRALRRNGKSSLPIKARILSGRELMVKKPECVTRDDNNILTFMCYHRIKKMDVKVTCLKKSAVVHIEDAYDTMLKTAKCMILTAKGKKTTFLGFCAFKIVSRPKYCPYHFFGLVYIQDRNRFLNR